MKEEIKWFPLDRINELETAIGSMIDQPATSFAGLGCCLGLHGLRVREITNALVSHFSQQNRTLYVCPFDAKANKCQPLKGGVARTVELDASVADAIAKYRSTLKHQKSKWLFPNRNGSAYKPQRLSSAGRDLLIDLGMMKDKSTRFHMLRHTCAMRILTETNDIVLVQKHLGHRNIQTTMNYLTCLKQVPNSCRVKLNFSKD